MIELQALLRRIEHLLEIRQMEQNRLDTAQSYHYRIHQNPADHSGWTAWVTREQIRQLIDQDPVLSIGPNCWKPFLAWVQQSIGSVIARNSVTPWLYSCQASRRYAGLQRNKRIGDWTGKTLSKTGDAPSCASLVYARWCWRHNPAIRIFCERFKSQR